MHRTSLASLAFLVIFANAGCFRYHYRVAYAVPVVAVPVAYAQPPVAEAYGEPPPPAELPPPPPEPPPPPPQTARPMIVSTQPGQTTVIIVNTPPGRRPAPPPPPAPPQAPGADEPQDDGWFNRR